MDISQRSRQPGGSSTGGQFAAEARDSIGLDLTTSRQHEVNKELHYEAALALEKAMYAMGEVRGGYHGSARLVGDSYYLGLMEPMRDVVIGYVVADNNGQSDPERVEQIMDALGEGTSVAESVNPEPDPGEQILARSAKLIADLAVNPDTGEIDPNDPYTNGQLQLA